MAIIINGIRIEHPSAILIEQEQPEKQPKEVKKPTGRGSKK
jgi:hypothetical protein